MFRLLALGLFMLLAKSLSAERLTQNPSAFRQLLRTPNGQEMLRQAGQQEAESARRYAAREEQQRQRARAEKEECFRQSFDAQLRFSPRLATARALELARWATSGFQTPFTCDLHFNCVPWESLSRQQADATTRDLTLPIGEAIPSKPAILLGGLSANRKQR